ncbi:putative glycolipid-binding domain-containing protein [Microbacterium sp. NPDC077184]|uniref:putative glycolipid-binding domain-containing protein n=1 Tax=Microbacterium sp. NPDC077184 TaxID=3154764 RepID=UPI003449A0BF
MTHSGHVEPRSRTLTWQGTDDPTRMDRASVRLQDEGMTAFGSSTATAYALSWNLDAGDGWLTRTIDVAVHGDGWRRFLHLERSPEGEWTSRTESHGDTDLPPAGIAPDIDLSGALDCDLGLCPVTNTMPIRRLHLLDSPAETTHPPLVMAWIEVPSLRVLRSEQHYGPVDATTVSFRSGDFSAHITTDADGFVLDYPDLARRLPRL